MIAPFPLPPGTVETFAALLLAHVLADFVFQTRWMVHRKRNVLVMLLHAGLVLGLTTVMTGGVWAVALMATLAHLLIDILKTWTPARDTLTAFLLDQAAHLASLAWIAQAWPRTMQAGVLAPWAETLAAPYLLGAGIVVTILAGGPVVGLLTARFVAQAAPEGMPEAGRMIGMLERTMIFLLIAIDQPAGIGFLIAAKSILRFDTVTHQRAGEYVIIGTLASFTWALAMGYGTFALLEILPAKP